VKAGALRLDSVVELGEVLSGRAPGRTGASDITIADLTGVAIQDIVIAKAVLEGLRED
jgi:ornithine cyclodeaminase